MEVYAFCCLQIILVSVGLSLDYLIRDVGIVDLIPLNGTHISLAANRCLLIYDIERNTILVRADGCSLMHGKGHNTCMYKNALIASMRLLPHVYCYYCYNLLLINTAVTTTPLTKCYSCKYDCSFTYSNSQDTNHHFALLYFTYAILIPDYEYYGYCHALASATNTTTTLLLLLAIISAAILLPPPPLPLPPLPLPPLQTP